jgi:hypothetical protein
MAQTLPHTGLTLLEAYRAAKQAGMYLIDNGRGDVKVAPFVPPGWREIPLRVKVTAPDRGTVVCTERAAA